MRCLGYQVYQCCCVGCGYFMTLVTLFTSIHSSLELGEFWGHFLSCYRRVYGPVHDKIGVQAAMNCPVLNPRRFNERFYWGIAACSLVGDGKCFRMIYSILIQRKESRVGIAAVVTFRATLPWNLLDFIKFYLNSFPLFSCQIKPNFKNCKAGILGRDTL
jgi:hypothetical protein